MPFVCFALDFRGLCFFFYFFKNTIQKCHFFCFYFEKEEKFSILVDRWRTQRNLEFVADDSKLVRLSKKKFDSRGKGNEMLINLMKLTKNLQIFCLRVEEI